MQLRKYQWLYLIIVGLLWRLRFSSQDRCRDYKSRSLQIKCDEVTFKQPQVVMARGQRASPLANNLRQQSRVAPCVVPDATRKDTVEHSQLLQSPFLSAGWRKTFLITSVYGCSTLISFEFLLAPWGLPN